jgi:hypothetical protein
MTTYFLDLYRIKCIQLNGSVCMGVLDKVVIVGVVMGSVVCSSFYMVM